MKKVLFYFFIGLLVLPFIQWKYPIFTIGKLHGAYTPAKNIQISVANWFSGDFQSKKEKYLKDRIGFRPMLIRSYNQLLYTLFHMANNPGGVIGKQDYLYLESYIYNYTGENFVGYKKVNRVSSQLKYLQEYLADRGISLFTVIVPSKASFYPEFIPKRYIKPYPINNYKAYIHSFDSLNIDYIDLNAYLISLKNSSPYPMFPRNGLHWTYYGMAVGMDSVIKVVEKKRNLDLPEFTWEEPFQLRAKNGFRDYDAESFMNLYFELPRDSMPYPKFSFHTDSTKQKPKTVVIGDSYYWSPYRSDLPHHVFKWGGFWYYFNTAIWEENKIEKQVPIKDLNLEELILQQDVIIILASQATLHLYPYKFDEKVYRLFMPKDEKSLIKYYSDQLVFNNSKGIAEKAKNNKISFEDQVNADAKWLTRKYLEKHPDKNTQIKRIIARIKKSSKWVASIRRKAENRNISYEEMLKIDAEYIYKKKAKESK